MATLFCDRPHANALDFRTERFVVNRDRGLDIGTSRGVQHLERGDVMPEGVLEPEALRCLYEPPVRALETFAFARTLPDLCEACARKGIDLGADEVVSQEADALVEDPPELEEPEVPAAAARLGKKDLLSLSRKQLSDMCFKAGLPTHGSIEQLRHRLSARMA